MMNRVVMHHSGGGYTPNATDKRAYHRPIDGDGKPHSGTFDIEANAPGNIRKGAYAAHTLNLNTGSVGVSLCAMGGGKWADPFAGRFPVKPVQVDGMVAEVARICGVYGIKPERRFVLSHAEVQITLGVPQRNKWDFDYDPRGGSSRDPIAIGDELRAEIRLKMGDAIAPPVSIDRATVRQGSRGDDVVALQERLALTPDGIFGPLTRAAVVRFQRGYGLLPDGIVGPMTWAALSPRLKG